ncbi:class IV lanthionine synthetase LanL [Micromonospora echinospora]|uniref:class IV lanthionine synthetase LanL n=1 Tax=Micromonospora echinospora TaxID=1877 RepID=UPI003789BEA9
MNESVLVDCVRSVLARHGNGWQVHPGDFWCQVQPPQRRRRVQGWKLHVSATPLSAPLVLAAAAEVLVRHGCSFKFAGTLTRVRELNSRHVDRGGGGKFITAYPNCGDEELRTLAEELHTATRGLPGPTILSDRPYRLGSRVHYRYGAFEGVHMLGNDGTYEAMLVAPDGSLVLDQRKAWFTPPAWAPRDPFAPDRSGPPRRSATAPKPVLLDGRYVVREVIRHSFPGGVYRATDEQTGAEVIIKQGRPYTGADLTGRDVRDDRRHEAAMLTLFEPSGVTPRLVGLFEQQDDVFLAQEAVPGSTLRHWVSAHTALDDGDGWGLPVEDVLRLATGLVDLMELVHAKGFVLRDFNPNNVMVDDGQLRLIDLELLARPGQPVGRVFTPGYGAPEQVTSPDFGPAPEPTADLYSLGGTLFYLVSAVDPMLAEDEPHVRPHRERIENWLAHFSVGNPAARRLAGVIVALLHEDPAQRPDLTIVRTRLAQAGQPESRRDDATRTTGLGDGNLKRAIVDGIDYLVTSMRPADDDRLWPCGQSGETTDPLNVQHGAAGILGVLTQALRAEPDPALRGAVATAAAWISGRVPREPRALPGLYFGRSGTAWALLDAGRVLGDEQLVGQAVDLARRVPLRWPNPDVCHGTAGAGFTQLRFWEETGHGEFLDRVRQAADALVDAAQYRDGLVRWPIAKDFASQLAGLVHYGFAHGVAGVGAFLLAAGHATGETRYLDLAVAGADTLVSVAIRDRGAAYWTSSEKDGPRKSHWCSGSSGVGTFLTQLWRRTGDDRYGETAAEAAVAVRRSRWHAGPAQCHGLAGDAEFLLDLAEVSGERRYRDWADELAASIYVRHALRDGRMLAPDETAMTVIPDFNTGFSGVLALLLRLRDGNHRMWLPASFTAAEPVAAPR